MPPVDRAATAGMLSPAPATPPGLITGPALTGTETTTVRLNVREERPAEAAVTCAAPAAAPSVACTVATPVTSVCAEAALNVTDPDATLKFTVTPATGLPAASLIRTER